MEITNELFELYKKLIEKIYDSQDSYSEEEVTWFTPGIGKEYNNELMIVGRANNGWKTYIDKSDRNNMETDLIDVKKQFSENDMQWVVNQWGNNKFGNGYNTKKSAFFRLSRRLAEELIERNELVINKIVWSNLYKVGNVNGKNPSSCLKNVQYDHCRQILNKELTFFNPKVVIFLTGWNWAKSFLKDSENLMTTTTNKFVEFVGKSENALIIVGQHPQGKPELEHCQEILNEIKINSFTN